MRYLKIVLVLVLLTTSCAVLAEKNWDCSVIKDSHYIERTCSTVVTEVSSIEIENLTGGLELVLKKTHIEQAMGAVYKPVVFLDKLVKITSIFPPAVLKNQYLLTFDGSRLIVSINEIENTGWNNPFPITNMIMLLICVLMSSFLVDKNRSIFKRNAVIGLLVSIIYGIILLGHNINNLFAMQITVLGSIILLTILYLIKEECTGQESFKVFILVVVSLASTSVINTISSQDYLYNNSTVPLEWLGFCLLLITLECIIVFYLRHKDRSVLATS